MISYKDLIIIGKISKTYHKDCSVVVFPITDFPDRFYKVKIFFILDEKKQKLIANNKDGSYEFNTDKIKRVSNYFRLKIAGYDNAEMCERLYGYFIGIKEDDRYVLPKDTFYYYELIDSIVFDNDKEIGILRSIEDYGSGDLLKIELKENNSNDGKFTYIPFLKIFIKEINSKDKLIKLKLIPGFY